MASLSSINILFRADLTQFSSEMQNVTRQLRRSGQEMQALGKSLSFSVSVPLLAAGAAAIKFGSDYEESLNKVNESFKDTAGEVKSFSKTTLDGFGIAEGSALDMASLFGDMATSMGLTTKEASTMSTSLVGLAGDLSSFKNIGLEQATTALNGIFTGETESLKRLGVVMTETNLKQFALTQGYKKQFSELNQAEKVQLRYAYVLAQTKNAQGDFARTGGGAANQMRIFTESLKQAASDLGQIILPAFTSLVKSVNSAVKSFSSLSPGMKKTLVVTAGLVAAIGPLLTMYGKSLQLTAALVSNYAVFRASVVGLRLAKLALAIQTNALLVAENLALAGTQLFAAAQMVLTGNIIGATQAMNVFKASLLATPWGFVAAGVAVAVGAYFLLSENVKKLSEAQIQQAKIEKLSSEITASATSIIVQQRSALEQLLNTAKNKLLSDKERQSAIKEINRLSPEYLGNITLEGIETDKTRKAVDLYTEALLRGAKARAAQEKLTEITKKQIENEFKAIQAREQLNKQDAEWKKNQTDNIALQEQRNKLMALSSGPLMEQLSKAQKARNQEEIDFLNKIINDNHEYLSLINSINGSQQVANAILKERKKIEDIAAPKTAGTSGNTNQAFDDEIAKLQQFIQLVATTPGQIADAKKQIEALEFQKALALDPTSLIEVDGFEDRLKQISNVYTEFKTTMVDVGQLIGEAIENLKVDLAVGFGEMLGSVIAGTSKLGDMFQGVLGIVADFMVNLGKQLIAVGIATTAFKKATISLQGPLAIAAGIVLVAAGSAFKNTMQKGPAFRDGGIVGGNSYYGDKIMARLDSGEMVTNRKQQKNLWGMINPSVTASDVAIQLMGGFEIEGSKLRLVLDRADKRANRIG